MADMTEDVFQLGIKALIRNDDGEILLCQTNPRHGHVRYEQHWDLPGGRVDKGETPTDTLRREIDEELGISDIPVVGHVGMVLSNFRLPLANNDTSGLILSVYECKLPADSSPKISDEHVDVSWFAPPKAAELLAIKYPPEFCSLVSQL